MAKFQNKIEVIPSAKRLISSLRDIGYDFVHAVADLVDNSIAAGSTVVRIDLQFEGEDTWVRISDNGNGMSGTEITEAMRFGTDRQYDLQDLGKFGLGLKTSSLSQCTRLTVASRNNPSIKRIESRQWDLDYVSRTNKWEILNLPSADRPEELTGPLEKHTGTVVLWERLDRVLGYKIPWGERARLAFLQMADNLCQHLAMVFHRFLSGTATRRRKLRIFLNNTEVEPWDPFARDESATKEHKEEQFEVQTDDGKGLVGYRAFILPPQAKFSSPQRFNYYSGPAKWNSQQGFYVYRCDRIIQAGGWSRMRTFDEHTKLARVALDFKPDLDSAFALNVAKARVTLPPELRTLIKPYVEDLTRTARIVYGSGSNNSRSNGGRQSQVNRGSGRSSSPPPQPPNPPNHGANSTNSTQGASADSRNGLLGLVIDEAAIHLRETKALDKIKSHLRTHNPEAANELGW